MVDTLSEVYELAENAEIAIEDKMSKLLEDSQKFVRRYTKADVEAALGIAPKTINKYCDIAGIDYKRFEGAAWLITIEDFYKLQDSLAEHGVSCNFIKKTLSEKQLCQIITIANQKGGTGKTVTTATVASCIATHPSYGRLRIGIIDSDSQGTLSMYYATDRSTNDGIPSFGDLLLGDYKLKEGETMKEVVSSAFRETTIPNMRILPARFDDRQLEARFHMKIAKGELANPYSALNEMLEHVKDEFDIILIDTPPSMSYATFTALYASTSLIVPVAPTENDWDATLNWVTQLPAIFDALSLHGFEGFEDEIRFLLTNHDGKNTAIEITRKIGETFPGAVLGTSLNQNEAVRVCAQNLCTIFDVSKSEYFKSYKKPFDLSVNNAEAVTADIMNRILANWARQEKEHV